MWRAVHAGSNYPPALSVPRADGGRNYPRPSIGDHILESGHLAARGCCGRSRHTTRRHGLPGVVRLGSSAGFT
jgi:hypothetical protein